MHHKGRNRHHFEYWTDYNPEDKRVVPVKMPAVFVAEMFCDRMAASKTYMKENYTDAAPLNYFLKSKARRIINQETSELLEGWLTTLAERGEKEAFAEIRRYLKKHKQK